MSALEKLKAGKRNTKIIKFPGTDQEVVLQILSNQEIQDSVFATENLFKARDLKVEIPSTLVEALLDERATQQLWRALRDPEDIKKHFAATVDELRKSLTKDEKDFLAQEYEAFEKECSPSFARMSDADFDNLWEEVKKTPELLNGLSLATLRRLLHISASRPPSSPTASGSSS